jgi:hypothetical protein
MPLAFKPIWRYWVERIGLSVQSEDIKTPPRSWPDEVWTEVFLCERRPRRDNLPETTTHRPEGGAPTVTASLIAVPNTSLSLQTSQGRIHNAQPPTYDLRHRN